MKVLKKWPQDYGLERFTMHKITNYGHDMAFNGAVSPSMERLLNAVESGADIDHPLLKRAEEMGLITPY